MSALLMMRAVSVRLRARDVLRDASLRVGVGEIVALLGPNGAGKTTLMRAGLRSIGADGEISLGGAPPRDLSARERALRAAYLPQKPQSVWPVSVENLVALGRYVYGAAPERLSARDQVAVDEAIAKCALGDLRTRRMDEISGGEQVRAHLARVLAQGAPLLVLDEPTAGLDPAQALGVLEILRAHAASGGGVLFSTHDVSLAAAAAHCVAVLHEGRVIAQGAPPETLTPDVMSRAYGRRGRLENIGGSVVAIFE